MQFIRVKTTDSYRDIPPAYKFHKEDKKVRHAGKSRGRSEFEMPSEIHYGSVPGGTANAGQEVSKLILFDQEVDHMVQKYYEKLEISEDSCQILLDTEEEYTNLCIKIRQTIGRWCSGTGKPSHHKLDDIMGLPPFRVTKHLENLESLRKDRDHRVKNALEYQTALQNGMGIKNGLFQWFSDQIHGTSSGLSRDYMEKGLKSLSSHLSSDFSTNVRLYLTALICYRNWRAIIPGHMISSQMEGIIENMIANHQDGNPNCKPDIHCYNQLFLHYQQLEPDIATAKTALKVLTELIENPNLVSPTLESFQIVMSIFQSVASSKCKDDVKREVVNNAEKILQLLENERFEKSLEVKFNQPFKVMCSILIAVGPSLLPDYLERVHNVMIRMIGQKAYDCLLSDNSALIDEPRVDHKIAHDLVHLFSMSADRDALDKAKIILTKMENTRREVENKTSAIKWDRKYPRRSSYNSLILGMFHTSFENSDSNHDSSDAESDELDESRELVFEDDAEVNRKVQDAIYCTDLLDLMLQRQESIPNALTYYRIVKMWIVTGSKEAGERGETLLSRLNLFSAFTNDKNQLNDIRMKVKASVLDCWKVSASAGKANAAMRSYRLFQRIYEEESLDLDSDDIKRQREKYFLFMKVIAACSQTKLEEDKSNAIDIALKLHKQMKEDGIPLTPYSYILLLRCFHGYTSDHESKISLSSYLFQQACDDGLVNRYVLNSLKNANPFMFEHYQKNPDHFRCGNIL